MDADDHYALRTGPAPLPDGSSASLTVHDLGVLRVASGRLGACDPFAWIDEPIVVPIPPGVYPVRVTVADVSPAQDGSHLREAYLSLVISDGRPASVEPAPRDSGPPEAGRLFVVGVDTATVAFVDADSVERCMPPDDASWETEVFDSEEPDCWFAALESDTPLRRGSANLVMPRATSGENVVLCYSGWGDGTYPLVQTRDAGGRLLAVHIDLRVVGNPRPAGA
jgi:hypothetical protein